VQRAQVTALLERAEKAEARAEAAELEQYHLERALKRDQEAGKIAYGTGFKYALALLDKGGYVTAADYLNESVVVVGVKK
jgi:hypothetical protein